MVIRFNLIFNRSTRKANNINAQFAIKGRKKQVKNVSSIHLNIITQKRKQDLGREAHHHEQDTTRSSLRTRSRVQQKSRAWAAKAWADLATLGHVMGGRRRSITPPPPPPRRSHRPTKKKPSNPKRLSFSQPPLITMGLAKKTKKQQRAGAVNWRG